MSLVASPDSLTFSIDCDGTAIGVRNALAEILVRIRPLDLEVEEIATVEIVLAEMMNNIVEHAYVEHSGSVSVACKQLDTGLHFSICDMGLPMPEGQKPFGCIPRINDVIGDLPEGGFGWFLIDGLARDVEYTRESETNCLNFRIAVATKQS